ncbi:hypothetical protein EON67_02535 [archaeon]|nr:MAG: hypothetical protein EON67_02535 [archaeon]
MSSDAAVDALPATTLYVVRHGETSWNVEGRYQGQQDVPLNDTGIAQVRLCAHVYVWVWLGG